MGQDFRAILDRGLKEDHLAGLPGMLDCEMALIEQFLAVAKLKNIQASPGQSYPPTKWQWGWDPNNDPPFDEWLKSGTASVWGPSSLVIDIGEHAVSIACWVRWREFLLKPHIREALRGITWHFSRCLHATTAIYLPDSNWLPAEHALNGVITSLSLNEILGQLQTEAPSSGLPIAAISPALAVSSQAKAYQRMTECYYTDSFEDLKSRCV